MPRVSRRDAADAPARGCRRYEQAVGLEVALNGEEFTDGGRMFAYYRHPIIEAVSPTRGSASKSQLLTVTRSTAVASGAWAPSHLLAAPEYRCRFETIMDPDGRRQVWRAPTARPLALAPRARAGVRRRLRR